MLPVRQIVSGVAVSPPIPIDRYRSPSGAAIKVDVSATATYTVQYTYDDVYAPAFNPGTASWVNHPTFTAATTSLDGNLAFPATAIRLNVSANTGTVTMTFITAGI